MGGGMAEQGNNVVTEYWLRHYLNGSLCSLCGNRGFIDTTGVTSPAGVHAGRVNYCICPNGQALRLGGAALPKALTSSNPSADLPG